jgi:hypothetical protein
MRTLVLLLAAVSLPVFAAVGCGQNETASSATTLAPAESLMYGEIDLDPSGDQKRAIEELAAKFPGEGSAGERLQSLIEKALQESDAPISFQKDVEPWLGDTVAFFVTGGGRGDGPQSGAALIAADDEAAARDALDKAMEGKQREKSYEGVDYLLGEDDSAAAVVDGFAVIGTERGLKAAIDTAEGGSPLSEDDAYTDAVADAADDRLGLFYLNSPKLLETIQSGPGAQALGSFKDFFEDPYLATLDVDGDGLSFEADAPESLAKLFPFFGEGSALMNELPADSWLAFAQPDLGKVLDHYVEAFGASFGGREVLESQLRAMTGLDLQRDVLGWMGDFAVFVRGTSVSDLNGALVIETKDPEASVRLLSRLEVLAGRSDQSSGTRVGPLSAPGGGDGFTLRDDEFAAPIHIFQREDRVVVAYGDAAARDAFDPAENLGDSPGYADAAKSLDGYAISMYLAVEPILELIDSTEAGADPGWQEARPYLEPLKALVAGTQGDAGELRSALKLLVE